MARQQGAGAYNLSADPGESCLHYLYHDLDDGKLFSKREEGRKCSTGNQRDPCAKPAKVNTTWAEQCKLAEKG